MPTISILDEHRRRNFTTRGRWEAIARHRERVMNLIAEASEPISKVPESDQGVLFQGMAPSRRPTICILGPGNANDIDLKQIAHDFESVTLVDVDEAAVERAMSSLDHDVLSQINRCCPVDLTGVLPVLESWRRTGRPHDSQLSAVRRTARSAPRPTTETFDVVASTCILTQLIDAVYMSLPMRDPRSVELLMAVRDRHLEMILELLNPGGVGVLVTDFAVAEPEHELFALDELLLAPSTTTTGMRRQYFFLGTDPFEIREYYKRLRGPGPTVDDVRLRGPWRWEVGNRWVGVCGVIARRTPEHSPHRCGDAVVSPA
jgi:hypothetical protein